MEINILEQKKNRIVFELAGSDHTLCNALKNELWNDKDVKVATYTIKHPLLAVPKFIIETSGKEATKALLDATGRLKKEYKSIATIMVKA